VRFHALANAALRGVDRAGERLRQRQSLKARLSVAREAQQLLEKAVHAVDGLARQTNELFTQARIVPQLLEVLGEGLDRDHGILQFVSELGDDHLELAN